MLQDNSAEVLFASMSENPHHLEHPHLGGNHLTGVDPVLIGRSLFGLKTINLCGTKLTWDQISVDLALIFNWNTLEFIASDLYQFLEYLHFKNMKYDPRGKEPTVFSDS